MILKALIKKAANSKTALIIFLAAVILYFSLRLPILTKIPVFVDEAIYIRWSQIMKNEPSLRFLPLSDGKPPLFMWATMPFFKVFNDPLVAGRMVSVASGFFALAGISLLAFIVTNNLLTASLSALILAVTPFNVFFDRMALVDSLLSALGLWSLALGVLFVKTLRLDVAMILGGTLGLALLTKSPAIFFFLWQPLLALFFLKRKPLSAAKLLGGWLVAFIISYGIYNILRLGPNFHLVNSRNQDYLYTYSEVLTHLNKPLVHNLKQTWAWLWSLITPVTLLLAASALFVKKHRKTAIAFILISAVPLLAQGLVAKVYTSRYILFAVTPLLVPAALGLKARPILLLLLVFPLVVSLGYVFRPVDIKMPFDMRNGYLEEWTAGWGQKEIGDFLKEKAKVGQKVVVGTEGFFGSLPDGLQIYTQGLSNITVIGSSPYVGDIPESLTNSLTDPQNEVYFVVNKSRLHLPADQMERLKLIAEYPKPPRSDASREALLFFQLTY